MSSDGWQDYAIGDLAKIKHGWSFKGELFSDNLTGRPIVVNIGNFEYTGGFRFEGTKVREYIGDYPKEFELMPNDILLVMTCQTEGGEILGIPGKIPNDGKVYLHNQRMGKVEIIEPELVTNDFLYYLFLWKDFNQHLVETASGTKILHTAPTRIESFRFSLPTKKEQQKIAHILSVLDNKIEINSRMTHTLESMAQALFKSWFVDLDPVVAKSEGRQPYGMSSETAALFPSEFQDSKLGTIPKGWQYVKISEVITNFDSRRVPLSGAQRSLRQGIYPYYGAASIMDYIDDYLFDGIYLLVGEDGSVEDTTGLAVTQYVWGKFWVNNHAHVLLGKNGISTEHIYLHYKFEPISPYVTGAVQPKINQANLNSMPFLLPSKEIAQEFTKTINYWFAKIRANYEEIKTLSAIRNALLPKLLSGEIRVKVT